MAMRLKPIRIETTSDQVTSILRNAILNNQYKDGDALNLNEVAADLGVSNTPVRAAFQILANDGLIRLRPNKGAVVVGITPKRVHDYYQVRIILESHAASFACEAESQEKLISAFEEAEACVRNQEWEQYKHCNRHFHGAIWDMCDNEKMMNMMSTLWISSSRSAYTSETDYVRDSHEEHRKIYHAIIKKDAKLAYLEMEKHLTRSMKDVLSHLNVKS